MAKGRKTKAAKASAEKAGSAGAAAGLVSGAIPALLDNAPALWAAARELFQSRGEAKKESPVREPQTPATRPDSRFVQEIGEVRANLLDLDARTERVATLVASLAESNRALARRVERQQGWLVGLALIGGIAIALAIAAVAVVLAR